MQPSCCRAPRRGEISALFTRNISKMTKPEHVKCKAVNKLKSHAVTNVTVTVISVSQICTESFCNWNKINYGVGRSDLRSEQEVVLWQKRWRGHYRVWDASNAQRGLFSLLGTKQPETRESRAVLAWTEWWQNAAIMFICEHRGGGSDCG